MGPCDTRVKKKYMNEPRLHMNESDARIKMRYINELRPYVVRFAMSNSMLGHLLTKHGKRTRVGLWD